MKRSITGIVAVLAVTVAGMSAGGCASTVEPGVTANFGTIHAQLPGKPKDVIRATRAALSDMNLILVSANASQLGGQVMARTSDDKPITINVKSKSNEVSKIAIKVGGYGDEKMGLSVLRNIEKKLQQQKGAQASLSPAMRGSMLGLDPQ